MALTIQNISKTNPWEYIKCPVCGSSNFTSLDHTSVWCDQCNAQFDVRYTAGDPGFCVDCRTGDVFSDYREAAKERLMCSVATYVHKEGCGDYIWYHYKDGKHNQVPPLPNGEPWTQIEANMNVNS